MTVHHHGGPWLCLAMLALLLCSSCHNTRKTAVEHEPAKQRAKLETCGNGSVDPGELCDRSSEVRHACPSGWGACYVCDEWCSGYALESFTYSVGYIERRPEQYNDSCCSVLSRPEMRGACTLVDEEYPRRHEKTLWTRHVDDKGRTTRFTRDLQSDGKIDHQVRYRYLDDNVVVIETDEGADGTVERSRREVRDKEGNIVYKTWAGEDGHFNGWSRDRYDTAGHKVLEETDRDGDGQVDERNRSTYDTSGNETLSEVDRDGDGKVDERDRYVYDTAGRMVLWHRERDGDADFERRYKYDDAGNKVLEEDIEGGALERRSHWAYDSAGNEILKEEDEDGDGTVDSRTTSMYDASGRKVLKEWDRDGDGHVDRRTRMTYDAAGNLILREEEKDTDDDGNVDSRSSSRSEYDAKGNRVLSESDYDADGKIDSRDRWAYDANSNKILEESDRDADGVVDSRRRWHFNSAGRLVMKKKPEYSDGKRVIARYRYDKHGQMTLDEHDDPYRKWYRRTYDYSCLEHLHGKAPKATFKLKKDFPNEY